MKEFYICLLTVSLKVQKIFYKKIIEKKYKEL